MSAHIQYVTLPGRRISEEAKFFHHTLRSNPESFQCKLLGELCQDFVNGNIYLCVWQCKLSQKVFWTELNGQHDEDRARLLNQSQHTFEGGCAGGPTLHPVTHENLNQFCHFVRGWRPDCGMYDKEDRENLVIAIRQVFNHAVV